METKNFVLLVCIFFTAKVCGEVPKAPSYLHTCPIDVPDMDACIIQKAKESLPGILKGDKTLKIPSFLPLKLKEVVVNAGNIVFKLLNFELYGLELAELTYSKLDLKILHFNGIIKIPEVRVNGTYDVDGQIMILPIKGHGPGYLQFEGLEISERIDMGMQEREGYHYITFQNYNLDYTVKNARFIFDSLFNGDKVLGDQMNKFLNENWKEFHADLKPAIRNMMERVILEMDKLFLNYVPLEVIFPGWKPE